MVLPTSTLAFGLFCLLELLSLSSSLASSLSSLQASSMLCSVSLHLLSPGFGLYPPTVPSRSGQFTLLCWNDRVGQIYCTLDLQLPAMLVLEAVSQNTADSSICPKESRRPSVKGTVSSTTQIWPGAQSHYPLGGLFTVTFWSPLKLLCPASSGPWPLDPGIMDITLSVHGLPRPSTTMVSALTTRSLRLLKEILISQQRSLRRLLQLSRRRTGSTSRTTGRRSGLLLHLPSRPVERLSTLSINRRSSSTDPRLLQTSSTTAYPATMLLRTALSSRSMRQGPVIIGSLRRQKGSHRTTVMSATRASSTLLALRPTRSLRHTRMLRGWLLDRCFFVLTMSDQG